MCGSAVIGTESLEIRAEYKKNSRLQTQEECGTSPLSLHFSLFNVLIMSCPFQVAEQWLSILCHGGPRVCRFSAPIKKNTLLPLAPLQLHRRRTNEGLALPQDLVAGKPDAQNVEKPL